MRTPRIDVTVDRMWLGGGCMVAARGFIAFAEDRMAHSHTPFSLLFTGADLLFASICVAVGIYHLAGRCRWGLRRLAELAK